MLATADGDPAGLGQRVVQGSCVHEVYFALVNTVFEALLVNHSWDKPLIWPVLIWNLSELFKESLANKLGRFVWRRSMTGSKDRPSLLIMDILFPAYRCHGDRDYS